MVSKVEGLRSLITHLLDLLSRHVPSVKRLNLDDPPYVSENVITKPVIFVPVGGQVQGVVSVRPLTATALAQWIIEVTVRVLLSHPY